MDYRERTHEKMLDRIKEYKFHSDYCTMKTGVTYERQIKLEFPLPHKTLSNLLFLYHTLFHSDDKCQLDKTQMCHHRIQKDHILKWWNDTVLLFSLPLNRCRNRIKKIMT